MSKVECEEGDTIYFKFEGQRHKGEVKGVHEHVIFISRNSLYVECFLHTELEEWAIE